MAGKNNQFDLMVIKSINAPFNTGAQQNDYSCFDTLKDKFGVYAFQKADDGTVLYIGEAHSQDVKTRVCQNYTKSDTGGTFRKNWCETEEWGQARIISWLHDAISFQNRNSID